VLLNQYFDVSSRSQDERENWEKVGGSEVLCTLVGSGLFFSCADQLPRLSASGSDATKILDVYFLLRINVAIGNEMR
jgi:hypothetical protein